MSPRSVVCNCKSCSSCFSICPLDALLLLQAADGDDIDAILSLVGIVAHGREDHEEGGGLHLCGVDLGGEFREGAYALLYGLLATQLDLHQPVRPVAQVDDGITLQPLLVAVVIDASVYGVGRT